MRYISGKDDILNQYIIKENLFEQIYKYSLEIPSTDRCFLNPIGFKSHILMDYPLVKIYTRYVKYGSTKILKYDSDDIDKVAGKHLTITKEKTLYLGVIDICYSIVRMLIDNIIQPINRIGAIDTIRVMLRYTKPTCGRITSSYIGGLKDLNLVKLNNLEMLEFISERALKYHCEFIEVGLDIYSMLEDISKLMVI